MLQAQSYYYHLEEASCRNIDGHRLMEKSVQLAALQQQLEPPALPDYWAPMNAKVGATIHVLVHQTGPPMQSTGPPILMQGWESVY